MVYCLVVLQEAGPDDILVQHVGAIPGDGRHAPDQEQALQGRRHFTPGLEETQRSDGKTQTIPMHQL